jgi:peptidoglycan hydrolase-like protein with peptidoglycan-binding domain
MSHPVLRLSDGLPDTSPELQDAVKELQTNLNNFGFDLPVNGIFSAETEASVRQFQQDHGLVSDGVVGPLTWSALEQAATPAPATTTFSTSISNDNPGMNADFNAALAFKPLIIAAAAKISVPSVIIAAIGSRESRWGLGNKPPGPSGTGDFKPRSNTQPFRPGPLPPDGKGYGRGLMQIDFDASEFARTGNWQDPEANINQGCSVLKTNLVLLGRRTQLTGQDLLRAAIAAYNCGAGNVLKALNANEDVDSRTALGNYSRDVINRAGFFQNKGWDAQSITANV